MKIWTKLSSPTTGSSAGGERASGAGTTSNTPPSRTRSLRVDSGHSTSGRDTRLPSARFARGGGSNGIALGFPSGAQYPDTLGRRLRDLVERYTFSFVVLLPTLLVAIYFFAYASPQYVSEARFVVKTQASAAGTLAMDLMGSAKGVGASENEHAISAHLRSNDALRSLRPRMNLVETFRPPHADLYSRLWWSNPSAERLLDHFRQQVVIVPDAYTGIVAMAVRTYTPQESLALARNLLEIGEEWVTRINQRILDETLRASREVVERAEARLAAATVAITEFRQRELALNPTRSAELAVGTIGGLDTEATRLRSELQQLQAFSRPNTRQIQNLRERIAAIERQAQEERARLSNADRGVTQQVAGFERLQLELDFAGRGLAAAVGGFETATANAQRQQIFLQRVVEPNLAERSLYPKPMIFTLYVFGGLALIYGLAWLVIAGVREHAA
jgi:capsular polysaccharide transport system permease protein